MRRRSTEILPDKQLTHQQGVTALSRTHPRAKEDVMKKLVMEYSEGCMLLKKRISELTAQLHELRDAGKYDEIEKLMLEKRIKLLYI